LLDVLARLFVAGLLDLRQQVADVPQALSDDGLLQVGLREIASDVVMPFFGLMPSLEFMVGSGVDIERGLLVNPELKSTDPHIWAAGDVCQIWSADENAYRFYYGWKNVNAMGELAARNMTGSEQPFQTFIDETLTVDKAGRLHSSFWDHG
jgi:NAD(P)H-nitrite reductase large subunit